MAPIIHRYCFGMLLPGRYGNGSSSVAGSILVLF